MTDKIKRTLRLVWDADAIQRGIAAWKRRNHRLMQERDDRKRVERKAKRERQGSRPPDSI